MGFVKSAVDGKSDGARGVVEEVGEGQWDWDGNGNGVRTVKRGGWKKEK
jgi:hypothetical protein